MPSFVFLSNFFNHHQSDLCDELYLLLDKDFLFIETETIPEERKKLGYREIKRPYVISSDFFNLNKEKYQKIIDSCDVVIIGSAPDELLSFRKHENKIVFKYSERIFKSLFDIFKFPIRLLKTKQYGKRSYLLSAGPYCKQDYRFLGLYRNKAFKFGYFPLFEDVKDVDSLISKKEKQSLVWCGRLISWKQPWLALNCVYRLKKKHNILCHLTIIGTGPLQDKLLRIAQRYHINDQINFLGSIPFNEVREYMKNNQIFLFTSRRNEGWGAVLNEAMNSCCVCVASKQAGSSKYLINDNDNGFLFNSSSKKSLESALIKAIKSDHAFVGKNAYFTIKNEWSAKVAASNLVALFYAISNKTDPPSSGPGSLA